MVVTITEFYRPYSSSTSDIKDVVAVFRDGCEVQPAVVGKCIYPVLEVYLLVNKWFVELTPFGMESIK